MKTYPTSHRVDPDFHAGRENGDRDRTLTVCMVLYFHAQPREADMALPFPAQQTQTSNSRDSGQDRDVFPDDFGR